MLIYVTGDLFQSPAQVLVNPVNTVGVMGGGLARDFKRFYPAMFDHYHAICQQDRLDVGQLLLYRTPHKWVLNFPTKRHYRADAHTDYIEAGLRKFASVYANVGITSASFPALGTDELDWESAVRPLLEAYLDPLPIPIFVHRLDDEDPFMPEKRPLRTLRAWLNGQPEIIPFERFWQDLNAALKSVSAGLQTLDGRFEPFIVTSAWRGKRRSLSLQPSQGEARYLAESSLQDVWAYIRRAGYVLPQNLPAGLHEHAPYLVALLAQLPYLSPVHLALPGHETVVGLHYVPPTARQTSTQVIQWEDNP